MDARPATLTIVPILALLASLAGAEWQVARADADGTAGLYRRVREFEKAARDPNARDADLARFLPPGTATPQVLHWLRLVATLERDPLGTQLQNVSVDRDQRTGVTRIVSVRFVVRGLGGQDDDVLVHWLWTRDGQWYVDPTGGER